MLFKSKKGADAASAATLVAIIGALIVLYILFIPPEERAEILGEVDEEGNVISTIDDDNITLLLSETPKRLFPAEDKEFEIDLPSVNIRVGEEGVELKKVNNLYVSRSLFKSKSANLSFNIVDLQNTQAALLSFFVDEGDGRLIIRLNNQEIFNKDIEKGNINPIDMRDYLIQDKNTLEFEVSSPGAAFWDTNEYTLEDLIITADLLRRESQRSELIFVVDSTERNNLKKVKLRFVPDCQEATAGSLSISLNNYNLYLGVPDCGYPNRAIEFLPDRLIIGENKLTFETEKGWYLIDSIEISSELKDIIVPIYYFELEEDEIKEIEDGEANITLFMKFVDDTERKIADLYVNNHAIRLDQEEMEFNQSLNKLVEKGNNALKIDPEEVLDIVELKIELES